MYDAGVRKEQGRAGAVYDAGVRKEQGRAGQSSTEQALYMMVGLLLFQGYLFGNSSRSNTKIKHLSSSAVLFLSQ